MSNILITGGCGFIGHHFVEHFLKESPDNNIVIFDKLNYSGTLDRLRDIEAYDDERVQVLTVDFTQPISYNVMKECADIEYVFHLGAETHVDNSIEDPFAFVNSNVLGTHYMLEMATSLKHLKRFFYFSTDEVYGPAPKGVFYQETDKLNPNNPYAATKAGGEMLCIAYENTYRLPITITRTMNVFGERQHPEKFIPLCINKILAGERIDIHANSDCTESGSRFYIHARNVADAYSTLLQRDATGLEIFNIVGEREVSNLDLALMIGGFLNRPALTRLVDFHSSRPGHDLRYAMSGKEIRSKAGWRPAKTFQESLEKTVNWYLENPRWLGEES